jgi:hypothetical protein
MQSLILVIQTFLARNGAPEWLLRPSAWIALTAALALIVVILRSLLRRTAEPAQAPSRR